MFLCGNTPVGLNSYRHLYMFLHYNLHPPDSFCPVVIIYCMKTRRARIYVWPFQVLRSVYSWLWGIHRISLLICPAPFFAVWLFRHFPLHCPTCIRFRCIHKSSLLLSYLTGFETANSQNLTCRHKSPKQSLRLLAGLLPWKGKKEHRFVFSSDSEPMLTICITFIKF